MYIKQLLLAASALAPLLGAASAFARKAESPYVRLAELEIDPAQIERFKASVKEEIEASIRIEPGVLSLHAISLKDQPFNIRVLEMYLDAAAYAAHLKTPHSSSSKPKPKRS